jgi:hypothetical protein
MQEVPQGPLLAQIPRRTLAEDLPIAGAAALLAGATFFPWYRGFGRTASGFETGTWGPVIFFLALASMLTIALRRLRLPLTLPFEESLLHEGVGWISVIAVIVKASRTPAINGVPGMGVAWGIWPALAAALALGFLGAQMSPRAPLVIRPDWYRGAGGAAAALILATAVTGSVAAAASVSYDLRGALLARVGITPQSPPKIVRNRLPDCANGFPIPPAVRPTIGFEARRPGGLCLAQLRSTQPPQRLVVLYERQLRRAGWQFGTSSASPGQVATLQLTSPRCGTVAFVPGLGGGSVATVSLTRCTS